MRITFEFELNRAWIIDSDGEVYGETNFVVSQKFLKEMFNTYFLDEYETLDDFLSSYEPEVDGELIYRKALETGNLLEDIGVTIVKADN